MESLLPADKYEVINKTILTEDDRKNIISLYEPIIGSDAVSLYFTLWRDTEIKIIYTHHHLMTLLRKNLETIKKSRVILEGIGLLKTYFKEGDVNSYIYEIYSPLSPKEFFSNPIFNVVLYNNIGSYEYDNLKKQFMKQTYSLKDYSDITKKFDEVFKVTSDNIDLSFESVSKETNSIEFKNEVNFDLVLSSIPKGIINEKAFNKRIKDLINNLAFAYNLDTLKISELLRLSINEKGFIDKETLRVETRKYYQYNNHGRLPTIIYQTQPDFLKAPIGDTSKKGMIINVFENTSPYDFLSSKYGGGMPTSRDLRLLEYLLIDVGLTPSVVNVLIDYVLKKNNNKLNKSFIETIAGQWKRLDIKTAKEAMETAEKENKKYNKLGKENVSSPVWFDKTINKENLDEEEEKELNNILDKYQE